jgi:hypothetical protein
MPDQPPPCFFCKTRPGTIASTNGVEDRHLCNDCWRAVWRYHVARRGGGLRARWAGRMLLRDVGRSR